MWLFGATTGESQYHRSQYHRLCDKKIYYAELCDYFNYYERQTGSTIIIASHPIASSVENRENFKDRMVVHGDTAALVRDSKCVITHSSTAVSYPVIYRKPIILITSKNYRWALRRDIRFYANKLGSQLVDCSSNYHNDPITTGINSDKYDKYSKHFLKNDGTEERLIWDIFADFLKQ